MKNLILLIILSATLCFAQSGKAPPNSLLPNFKPFDTPRTNCRPGTVYRCDENGINFIVKDIKNKKRDSQRKSPLSAPLRHIFLMLTQSFITRRQVAPGFCRYLP